jgi:AraC-like DNA-binding protein
MLDRRTETQVFWRHPRFRDMGLLKARFTQHRYDLHTHPTYVIALITCGCERLMIDGRTHIAPMNSVILVNPEAPHDGEPGADDGWAYRTFYPPVSLMRDVARELGRDTIPMFPNVIVDDPRLAQCIAAAHTATEEAGAPNADTLMLLALRKLIVDYSDRAMRPDPLDRVASRQRFAIYQDIIERDLNADLHLGHLASVAGVTRFQVIRDFSIVSGLTPGKFIRNRRVRLATQLIEQGVSLSEAAATAGFADQSHLSRAFRATHGITPGMLQRAWLR